MTVTKAEAEIAAVVAAGVAWLDEQPDGPAWVTDIDLQELDMTRPCACVLGQTGKRIIDTVARLGRVDFPSWHGDLLDWYDLDWYDVVLMFHPDARSDDVDDHATWPSRHGFDLFERDVDELRFDELRSWQMLENEWRRVITSRQACL